MMNDTLISTREPLPRPKTPAEIKAFIGRRREARYVRWMKGSPQKTSRKAGRSRLPQNRGREEKKGEAKYRSVNDSGMEGGGGEEERWPPSPPPPPQASSSQPGCRGTFPRRRGWQRATRSTESVRAPRPPQSTLPPAASSSSQMMPCAKNELIIIKKKSCGCTVRHRAPHTTNPEEEREQIHEREGKKNCNKKKTLKELKYNWGVAAGAGLLPRQKGWVQVLN